MAEAMKRLRAELAEARAIYDGRDKTPDGEEGAQAGAVNAIDAVVTFLRDSGVPRGDRQPLLVVLAAFRDHSSGKPHPLFAIEKRGGRRELSQDTMWQACVAVVVTLLRKAGVKKRDALANVADSLRKSGIKEITATKVDTWHRKISTGACADNAAGELYRSALGAADAAHPKSPRLAAEELLAELPSLKL